MSRALHKAGVVAAVVAAAGATVAVGSINFASADSATATTGVNIRSGPGTGNPIVGGLSRGQTITAIGSPENGWAKVRFNGSSAYISARYLDLDGNVTGSDPVRISTSGSKLSTATLNVRNGPGMDADVIGYFSQGQSVTLTGKQSDGWVEVLYGGERAWVSSQYLASSISGGSSSGSSSNGSAGSSGSDSSQTKGETALTYAKSQLGKPYVWAADGPDSFDCSGLTLRAWQAAGVELPRVTYDQINASPRVAKSDLRPGDLVFFHGSSPSHVGIYAGNGQIIHAPRPGESVEYTSLSSMPFSGATRPG